MISMNQVQNDEVRQHVRNRYKQIAIQDVPGANINDYIQASIIKAIKP